MSRTAPLELPALNWLGWAVDVTTADPLDIRAVSDSVKRARQIFRLERIDKEPDSPIRRGILHIDGVDYDIPESVLVHLHSKHSLENFAVYPDGRQASSVLLKRSEIGARYMAFAGNASTSYAVEKTFRKDDQFALFAFNSPRYDVCISDGFGVLNEIALEHRLSGMTQPFTDHPTTVREYKSFFSSFGSHVIIAASFGMRFQLVVHAPNDNNEINKGFQTDVVTAYGGVMTEGQFDPSIKEQAQYKTFLIEHQKLISVQGGDLDLGLKILNNPASYNDYAAWKAMIKDPALVNFGFVELWTLMKHASSSSVVNAAKNIEDAFNWIVSHPVVYRTAVTFSIESNFAEFGMLNPSAVIVPDSAVPIPRLVRFSQNKVIWGTEHGRDQGREIIRFFVINDGSPINFYTTRGSDDGSGRTGRATVVMEQTSFINEGVISENQNTMWFWRAKSSDSPAPFNIPEQDARQSDSPPSQPAKWDDVLDNYLSYIREHPLGVWAFDSERKAERLWSREETEDLPIALGDVLQ